MLYISFSALAISSCFAYSSIFLLVVLLSFLDVLLANSVHASFHSLSRVVPFPNNPLATPYNKLTIGLVVSEVMNFSTIAFVLIGDIWNDSPIVLYIFSTSSSYIPWYSGSIFSLSTPGFVLNTSLPVYGSILNAPIKNADTNGLLEASSE